MLKMLVAVASSAGFTDSGAICQLRAYGTGLLRWWCADIRYQLPPNDTVIARHTGIPEFHPMMEQFCTYYGTSIQVCQPADPATKGGVESSVKLAKDDILPKETNLRGEYDTFAQLEKACQEFMATANRRPHRVTGVAPEELLEQVELEQLAALPVDAPYTLFGEIRRVPTNTPHDQC